MKRILVTGNLGYIGAELTHALTERGDEVIGLDSDLYEARDLYTPASATSQVLGDIRSTPTELFSGMSAVVHLAGLSNDPLGELDESLTMDINYRASVRLAEQAKAAGVERFVMASTASVYGIADQIVSEDSALNPITMYAKSKLFAERDIARMSDDTFSPTFLRPATAFGIGARIRTDIVLNNLCAWAHATKTIRILSDGKPIRPAVCVQDIVQVILACLDAPRDLIHNEIFNVGHNEENYSIREMAEMVQHALPECTLSFTGEHTDSRSYHVCFDKLHSTLGRYLPPRITLAAGIESLLKGYRQYGLTESQFTTGKFSRIHTLKQRLSDGSINSRLFVRRPDPVSGGFGEVEKRGNAQ